jgi:ubiquinone/menaquinone biosynthesis C-methylase UbiE
MTQSPQIVPDAFNAAAASYDDEFTNTPLGRLLRRRVWRHLGRCFPSGSRVLELACGTGEDAVWLAEQGVQVTATDGSSEMVQVTREKAQARQVAGRVSARAVSLQMIIDQPEQIASAATFDGVFSNFGGLNVIQDWAGLAAALSPLVRPGGMALLVPMGPHCPWEIGWYLLHRQPDDAFRRWRKSAEATIGPATIPIWYPAARALRGAFAPWFEHVSTRSLGFWLPPSYLGQFVNARPGLFTWLNRFEQRTGRITGGWGDHYIMELRRTNRD